MQSQGEERVLYKYNNGQALVTDRRVVLGNETFPIENIANISLVPHKVFSPLRQIPLNETTLKGIILAVMLGAVGFPLIMFMPASDFQLPLTFLGVLIFVSGLMVGVRTVWDNPGEVYRARLTLISTAGKRSEHEATFTWEHKSAAEKSMHAVLQAVSEHQTPKPR